MFDRRKEFMKEMAKEQLKEEIRNRENPLLQYSTSKLKKELRRRKRGVNQNEQSI